MDPSLKLEQTFDAVKERNAAYAGLSSCEDLIALHRSWFAFFAQKPKKNEPAEPRRVKMIYPYSLLPGDKLAENIQLFVDLHDLEFLPVEWSFGTSRKLKSGGQLSRVSWVSGFMPRDQAEKLQYHLCGDSNMLMFVSESPLELINAPEPADIKQIIKEVVSIDANKPDSWWARGAEIEVEKRGVTRRSMLFPNWTAYKNMAEFLSDKNQSLFSSVLQKWLLVHVVDKQWCRTSTLFQNVKSALTTVRSEKMSLALNETLDQELEQQRKMRLCEQIYNRNPRLYSWSQLLKTSSDDLKVIYLDQNKLVGLADQKQQQNVAQNGVPRQEQKSNVEFNNETSSSWTAAASAASPMSTVPIAPEMINVDNRFGASSNPIRID